MADVRQAPAARREAVSGAARDMAGWSPGYRTSWAARPQALILEADGEPGRWGASLARLVALPPGYPGGELGTRGNVQLGEYMSQMCLHGPG